MGTSDCTRYFNLLKPSCCSPGRASSVSVCSKQTGSLLRLVPLVHPRPSILGVGISTCMNQIHFVQPLFTLAWTLISEGRNLRKHNCLNISSGWGVWVCVRSFQESPGSWSFRKPCAFPDKLLCAILSKELLSPHALPSFSLLPKMVGVFRNRLSGKLEVMLMYLSVTKDKIRVYKEECRCHSSI